MLQTYISTECSELARTLLPVESTNDKNESNSPQSYRRLIHSLMNTC